MTTLQLLPEPVTITLSLPYDLPPQQWAEVDRVFKSLHGWIGYSSDQIPQWFGDQKAKQFIWGSIEPSGLLIEGQMNIRIWIGWISVLCSRLSLALQMEIRDAES